MKLLPKLLSLCLAGVALASCSGKGSDDSDSDKTIYHNVFVFTPQVSAGGDNVISFPAVVEEAGNISVAFKTAGQLTRLLAKEGDNVRKGQLLAVLDTVDYALGVRQLRVQYGQQKAELERKKQLHASGNLSDNEFERAVAALHQLGLQLQLNENKLRYCHLYAPASGVITKKNFERAEMVDAGTPVYELMDNNHLEVVVDLPVANYLHHENFTSFKGRTAHNPDKEIPLTLLSITPKADNNQLYRMKLMVADGAADITPGMNLSVEVAGGGAGSVGAEVPLSAVFESKSGSAVWTVNPSDSTVRLTPVKTSGTGENGTVIVTEGLTPGLQIVRAGAHHLKDGEKVRVITEQSATNPGNLL